MAPEPSKLDSASENWPIIARLTGVTMGVVIMVGSFFGLPVSTPVLGFAGTLLLAPKIAGVQRRRNDLRRRSREALGGRDAGEDGP